MHAKTRVPSWTTDGVCAAALVYETMILKCSAVSAKAKRSGETPSKT